MGNREVWPWRPAQIERLDARKLCGKRRRGGIGDRGLFGRDRQGRKALLAGIAFAFLALRLLARAGAAKLAAETILLRRSFRHALEGSRKTENGEHGPEHPHHQVECADGKQNRGTARELEDTPRLAPPAPPPPPHPATAP